ncbi:unnamed protein product [Lymnaea stagnalis]|uniref:Poly [ADP-ribose] polymerase n=1 Tax=Lymnaea stagnalis TaxID=6523 RepID=A0AAV2HF22_LYMST
MRDSIKTRKQTLDYPGCREFLESSAGEDILRTSGKKFSCLIKLCEQDDADESLHESFEENLTLVEYVIIENCKVSITRGDPENLKVDCIFNFINTSFSTYTNMPKGFIGGQTSWNKIKKVLVFSVGQTIEFTGEKNRNLKIIHIVCNHEEKQLIEALKRGFNRVRTMKFKYIGIALDGIQHLQWSQGQFSKPLADHLTDQLHNNPNTVNEIYLCGNNEKHLHNVAIQLKLKHQETKPLDKSEGDVGEMEPKASVKSSFRIHEGQARMNVSSVTAFTMETRSKIVFKPITVELISGDILAEKTDAVVTSIKSDLDMKLGLVIRSVLQKGGDEIQNELQTKYPSGIKGGEFAVSGGGKLPFKRIYHANLPQWNSSSGGDVIKRLVTDMLNEASKESINSIAIPALGTGNLSYNSAISCKSILSAINDFAKQNQQTSLTTVKLVIYTTNADIMKEYGHAIFNFGTASQPQSIPTPISPIKKANISYGNIGVQLTIGDITTQKTDAIIVSVDCSLDLTKGRVAQNILNKGGPSIQTELKQKYPNGLKVYEYGMTGPGKLSCKEVYFVCIPHWNKFDKKQMKKLIVDVLTAIDNAKGATVSLPAFGTGNLGYPADDTQKRTLKGITAFTKGNPQNLRSIEIVVHPSDTVVQQAFQKGFHLPISAASQQMSQQIIIKEKNESPWILTKLLSAFGSLASYMGIGDQKSTENTFNVGTVTLTVKKGDITEESCDALVAAIYDNMDLETAGAVCYEISKKCTADFKSKCLLKANDLKVYGLTVMDVQGGSLKCKEIFFISMNQYHDKWDLAITKVLESADKSGFTTLALPTFGAGIPDTDINKLISQIKGAITKFGNDLPRKLKDIRLVVYDKDVLKRVSNANNEPSSPFYGALKENDDDELSENAHILYYFVDEVKVKGAMEEVITQCMVTHKENSYRNISIKQFTDSNFRSLEKKGIENMIKVTCIKDEGMIRLAGFGDMSKVHNMIHAIEKEMQREMFENLSTDTPVHWQYEDDGKFVDFNNLLNLQLEADFKGKKSSSVIEMDDETYTVDFENKIITHNDTGTIMNLIRRDALEAGEPIPKHWEPMSVNESLKVVNLPADCDEYKKVAAYFRFKDAVGNIHTIERVQNRSLYQQFVAKKREIDGRNPNHENELFLFHGSDINAISAINNTGFNRSYCGKNATVYGLGVYFAQSSAYSEQYASPDANGLRKLYQARVLVGVSVETDSKTKFLPKQPGTDIPYDSGKAPASRPEGIYVIFHDSQAYPEYIITFALPVNHVAT